MATKKEREKSIDFICGVIRRINRTRTCFEYCSVQIIDCEEISPKKSIMIYDSFSDFDALSSSDKRDFDSVVLAYTGSKDGVSEVHKHMVKGPDLKGNVYGIDVLIRSKENSNYEDPTSKDEIKFDSVLMYVKNELIAQGYKY